MKTSDYFMFYPAIQAKNLYCKICNAPIQYVEINFNDLHYRCSDDLCPRHKKGQTTDVSEYPSEWIDAR